jgi:hypothetical protein
MQMAKHDQLTNEKNLDRVMVHEILRVPWYVPEKKVGQCTATCLLSLQESNLAREQ